MLIDLSALYEEALHGEPVWQPVANTSLDTRPSIWVIGNATGSELLRELQRMIDDICGWTKWSTDRLTDVIGCGYGKVIAGEKSKPLFSCDMRQRLDLLHCLVERTYFLTNQNIDQTRATLDAVLSSRQNTLEEYFSIDNFAEVYLSVLDAIQPRQTGLLVGDRLRRDAPTTALHE
ncbi:MAG: hypothetical protein M1374_01780 [Firmicutes bacterium]|jgi:hypothetical protein|nr:hypothetical protein [Bacillota bacterium]